MKNIIETAVENPQFSTLVTAIKKAGLVDTLSGAGPFTVFAPTNKAFDKIPPRTLSAILEDIDKLKSILTYHVVSGKVMSKDVSNLKEVMTIQGSNVKIDTTNGIMINDSKVITPDIECSNGVIHVVDTVLMPK